ncbi:MAG: hypothetical protein IPN71_14790 [Fibrobacteres bacterium]|nr:hypothetical protein [Fibrobacterota bacterium]
MALSLLGVAACKQEPEPNYAELLANLEEDPFDTRLIETAVRAASRAESKGSKNHWAYILGAYANLRAGYSHGSTYKAKNYDESALREARRWAEKTLEICPDKVDCLIPMMRMDLIEWKQESLHSRLLQAYAMDSTNFYVWFYRAEVGMKLKDNASAYTFLDSAESFAKTKRQHRWVLEAKTSLAEREKNLGEAERLYHETIQQNPDDAYAYGNFGSFLLKHERYAEAVEFLEKAVALQPYPLSLKNLAEAKEKVGAK